MVAAERADLRPRLNPPIMVVLEAGPLDDYEELQQQIAALRDKLNRAYRQLAGLRAKGKLLGMQYDDARTREHNTTDIISELLERQRELNVMLNRANIMLNRTQETMALTSIEFNEMAKALPEPKRAEWSDRVSRINELFKKTGVQDAELVALKGPSSADPHSLETDELKRESEEAFGEREWIWEREDRPEPPTVEAVPVEEQPEAEISAEQTEPEVVTISAEPDGDGQIDADSLVFPPRRKSWWRRAAG